MRTEEIITGLTREVTKPVRPTNPWVMCSIWGGITLITFVVLVAYLGLRLDLSARLQEPLFILEMLLLVGLVISGATSSFWHSFPDFRQQHWLLLVPLPIFVAYAALLLYRAFVPAATAQPLDVDHSGLECALCITLFAPLPSSLMLWQIRRGATVMPRRAGLLAMLVSGAIGHLLLKFVESNDDVLHVITWHLLPISVLGLFGWLAGRKILAW